MAYRDPEQKRAYNASYYWTHRDAALKQQAVYRATHRVALTNSKASYYASHREERRKRDAAYYAANRYERLMRQIAYQETHRDERAAYNAAYCAANRDKKNGHSATQRARRLRLFVEEVDRAVVLARDASVCGECWAQGFPGIVDPNDWHLDHIIPLSRGGEHSYVNTQVTHPMCNLRKSSRAALAA